MNQSDTSNIERRNTQLQPQAQFSSEYILLLGCLLVSCIGSFPMITRPLTLADDTNFSGCKSESGAYSLGT